MSFHPGQLRALLHRVLDPHDLGGEDAVELLLLTCAQESRLGTYLEQLGGGPALGIYQMEPATHRDIWDNYLRYQPELRELALGFCCNNADPERLRWDLRYASLMSRLHYRRRPEALPAAGDVAGMAGYWKRHYNTPLGAGTADEAAENYRRLVLGG